MNSYGKLIDAVFSFVSGTFRFSLWTLRKQFSCSSPVKFSAGAVALTALSVPAENPNILLIIADDQGCGDIGINNPLVNSPHIDRLAAESARFKEFIAAPACTPSRAALLTGRNHLYTGVWGVGPRGYISRDETLFPEYLRRAGYRTAHFGKWESLQPEMRAYYIGYDEAGVLGGGYEHQNPRMDFNGELKTPGGWTSDILADLTIDFIERSTAENQPWFVVTAYIAPHSPWVSPEKYSAPLRAKGYSEPLAELYGMVEHMDAATGRILETVDRLGQKENTIVIYMSDNGATPVCPRTGGTPVNGEDWAKRNPLKLRGQKSSVWENGIRVPFFVRWPGKIPAGDRTQLGAVEDILPTVLDLAGISDEIVPGHLPFQGASLKKILMNPAAPETGRAYFRLPIAPPGMPLPQERDKIGIINDLAETDYNKDVHAVLYTPEYKFHHLSGGALELYNMKADAPEVRDLSGEQPELTAKLAAECRRQWDALVNSPRRTVTMPCFLIGDPRYDHTPPGWNQVLPPNVIPGDAPLKVFGKARSPYGFKGSGGFAAPEDSVVFGAEIITAGKYHVVVTGRNFSQSLPVVLNVGKNYSPEKSTDTELDFGELFFAAGKYDLHFSGSDEKNDAEEAVISAIRFICICRSDCQDNE